ncbi:MAG: transcription-repair coupling factor [Vicinamibacterales bacterium]
MTGSAAPSLALRALFHDAVAALGVVRAYRSISGLTPAAKAIVIAARARGERTVVVVPSDRDIDALVDDVRFFLSSLEGLSTSDVERAVLPFPSQEVDPYRGLAPHFDIAAARARGLHALASGSARVLVASVGALFPRISPPDRLTHVAIELTPGREIDPSELARLLVEGGFSRQDPVDEHGDFTVRGGLVDVFPAGESHPLRIEFVGDTIESIRRYDPSTQRSVETVDRATIVPLHDILENDGVDDSAERVPLDRGSHFIEYVGSIGQVGLVVSEWETTVQEGESFDAKLASSYADAVSRQERAIAPEHLCLPWADLAGLLARAMRLDTLAVVEPSDEPDRSSEAARHIACQPASQYRGRIPDWIAELAQARERRERAVAVAATTGKAERIVELLKDYGVPAALADRAEVTEGLSLLVVTGQLSRGFRLPDAHLQLYAETDIFDEERPAHERRRSVTRTFLSDFRDLKVGDHVVHVDHGIGVFVGLKKLSVGSDAQEFMELRYAEEHKLFVPMDRLDLVQKYTGGAKPTLDRLGGTTWEKAKTRVRKAMRDMAGELLKLYAARKSMIGHAFAADTHWQAEFEGAFEYELTPDQAQAVADIKRDMESSVPMDRLLCGDVGYGKTEVAMRAAFKAVMEGKQVALLAPTTVLAFQHLKTFRNRFAAFPVRIDMVSRFRSKAEQKAVLADLAAGKLDMLIGTHRLLSKDVEFHDLGLLIVDEEQRFGVAHKERIKQIRRRVDALAMSATPIPRTLNMSLVGIRDMSVIETPPRDRQAIQTNVVKFDQRVISRAIRTELDRGGQVYFVHNRVESIYSMGDLIKRLVPEARIGIGHGQMGEDALEKVMVDFVGHRFDVLLATTIIENGLDIPNANTLIVNRADRYGLAQLYQLRGRVGRSDRRAYAYLLIPPAEALSTVARSRLAAITEFSDLGSGFRIAALDLEIRGAGNLLGGEQSGHIEAVGFEMYMKLLEEAVRELKGEEIEEDVHATINLGADLHIDETYIPDMNQRLTIYRRVAACRSEPELDDALAGVRDRYGPLPGALLNLAAYSRIRILADRLRLESVDRERSTIVFKFRQNSTVDPQRFLGLIRERPDLKVTSPVTVAMDLRVPLGSKSSLARVRETRGDGVAPAGSPVGGVKPGSRKPPAPSSSGSWWTARAKAGEVAPGFTKEEVLKAPPEDPRAPGGTFERTLQLLRQLQAP